MAEWRDIVAIAERQAGRTVGIDRLQSYIATYATLDEGLPLLIGDAGHDFGNYIDTPIAGKTLISWAKQYIKNGTLKNDLNIYSTSKGEEHYLTFLESCRGNSRLTLAEDDIFDLRDESSMRSMIEKLKGEGCLHFVIDATYGNPIKHATGTMHVHDLITGKTDAGSGLGPKSVGNARYHDSTESFTIANYFGNTSLTFQICEGKPCISMSGNDVPGKSRKILIQKGVSVNALCEALGLPGIRKEGRAGSALRIDKSPHPIDLLFKTGTDLGTLLQSIDLEHSIRELVGTLTNDRFFKERAGQFERRVILFTPDSRSHKCQWWRSLPLAPLTDSDITSIRVKFDLYNPDTVLASLQRILNIQHEIEAEVEECTSFMNDYISQEITKIYDEYVKERGFWDKGKKLVLTKANAEPYRKLITSNVDIILRTKIEDSFVRFQERIVQVKTLLPNAFGRFKSIKSDETTKLSILDTIVKTIERVYIPNIGGAGAAGGEEDPQKRKWANSIVAHLSRNFASTFIIDYRGERLLNSSEAIGYILAITDERFKDYKQIFSKGVVTGILDEQEKKYTCAYDKIINIISKIIDNGLTEATALETKKVKEAEAARADDAARAARAAREVRAAEAARVAREVRAAEAARVVREAEAARVVREAEAAEAARVAREVRAAEAARVVREAEAARVVREAEAARVVREAEAAIEEDAAPAAGAAAEDAVIAEAEAAGAAAEDAVIAEAGAAKRGRTDSNNENSDGENGEHGVKKGRIQEGGANMLDSYPKCLLEHIIPGSDGFYYAEFNNAKEPKLPINEDEINSLFTSENILLLLHSLIYYLLDDFDSNNMGVLVESDLMTLRLLIVSPEIKDEELFEHIRFLVYDYDAISAMIVSRLTVKQLSKIRNDITLENISAKRPEAKGFFTPKENANFPEDCIPSSFFYPDVPSGEAEGGAAGGKVVAKVPGGEPMGVPAGGEPTDVPAGGKPIGGAGGPNTPILRAMIGSAYTRKVRRKRKTRSKRNRIYRKRTRKMHTKRK